MKRRTRVIIIVLASVPALAVLFFAPTLFFPLEPEPITAHPNPSSAQLEIPAGSEEATTISRLYMLQTGETRVPFGQFYGGHEGWIGIRALFNLITEDRDFQWVPVNVFLIVHPIQGVILFDAGLSRAQTEPGYYRGVTAFTHEENRVAEEQLLLTQLARLGFEAADVQHVILSHLHEDHIGEVAAFSNATVHLARDEWDDRRRVFTGVPGLGFGSYYARSYESVVNWNLYEYDSGRFESFAAAKDLFHDGSVVLLPTPGHSAGHASALLRLDGAEVVLASDSIYTLRHLDFETLAAFQFSERGLQTYSDSIRRIVALQKRRPGVVLVPGHDPFAYGRDHLPRAFADGQLSPDERDALLSHQRSLFTAEGRLRIAEIEP